MPCPDCISGFYEEGVPSYTQGSPTHELQKLMTAEEANYQAKKLAEALDAIQGLLEIGKRDLSNSKYDSYFESLRAVLGMKSDRNAADFLNHALKKG